MKFRLLKANEIDVRVGTSSEKGSTYLLYKDARVDMNILDETVGAMNWQREHEFKDGKLYCKVSIWDDEKKQWISKEDVGVESNAEAEKGQASDSFKRACVNWGIGRELYTAPFIWINISKEEAKKTKFYVKEIGYNDNNEIDKLILVDSKGNEVYKFPKWAKPTNNEKATEEQKQAIYKEIEIYTPVLEKKGILVEDLTYDQAEKLIEWRAKQ